MFRPFPPDFPAKVALTTFLLILGLFLSARPAAAAPCSGTQLQGVVYHDYDADGARSNGNVEGGIAGAVVSVFAADGSTASCESLADGSYGINAPSGGFPVRVEVGVPAAFGSFFPAAAGRTNVFFASAAASGLDVGFNVPEDFCQSNPEVVTALFLHGDPLFDGSLANVQNTVIEIDYDRTAASPTSLALGADVGTVWGIAYQRSSRSAFAAAVLRRHAGWGPLGVGGIYKIDFSSGTPVVSPFVDLAAIGIPVGVDPRSVAGEDPPGNGPTGNEPGLDNLAYEEVGKVGIGDIDVEEEAERLWVMSLGNGTLYALDIGAGATAPTAATAYPLPTAGCVDGVFRPWAVASHRGRIYVGGVCSNENISPYPTPAGFIDFPNLDAHVYSMNPDDGIFSLALSVPLNYRKGCAGGSSGCQWYPWTDLSTASLVPLAFGTIATLPTPILADLGFADDGDMILGFLDRTGLQYGLIAPAPNTTPTNTSIGNMFSGGDMLRADFDPSSGAFTLESNGVVGLVVGAGSANLQGPGGGEYYSASTAGFHFELSVGGLAVLPGSNHFVGSAMDPVTINSGGLIWMNDRGASPGARFVGYTLYAGTFPPNFGKGVGVGDVELRCEEAPVEIGNRVWCDSNDGQMLPDGIQGPGGTDTPLPGVTVELSCSGGAVVASTITAADGTYLFGVANVPGGIPKGATCTVSIDSTQAALGACRLPTLANQGADQRDSDGTDVDQDGTVEATVTVSGPGANDPTLDFGFTVRPAIGSIEGNVNCQGIGLGGVTVDLYEDLGCDGFADGGVLSSLESGPDGNFVFGNLPIGLNGFPLCYVVRVDGQDPDLGACVNPQTPLEYPVVLDDNVPTSMGNVFIFDQRAIVEVPTLSEMSLELLALLLAIAGFVALRRRG